MRYKPFAVTDAAVAFFTAVLAFVAIWQMSYLRAANEVAGRAAAAAEQSLRHAEGTAEKQLRAYVLATEGRVAGLNGNGPVKVQVSIKNSGQTPASKMRVEMDVSWEDFPAPHQNRFCRRQPPYRLCQDPDVFGITRKSGCGA